MAENVSKTEVLTEPQIILAESSKLLATIYDVSSFATNGGVNAINYPEMALATAQSLAIGASMTDENASFTDALLALTEKIGRSFSINKHVEAQNVLKTIELKTADILRAMGLKMDESIYAKLIASLQSAGENVVKTSDMYADICKMNKHLDDLNVPREGRVFWASNADYETLCNLTKNFIRFQSDVSGVVGEIAGVKVVRSTAVSGDSILLHKNAVVAGSQPLIFSQQEDASLPGTKYSISCMFGAFAAQGGNLAVRYGADPV